MKVKIKNKGSSLPNAWKACGMTMEEWDELKEGSVMDAKSLPEFLENMIEVVKSPSKEKGDK